MTDRVELLQQFRRSLEVLELPGSVALGEAALHVAQLRLLKAGTLDFEMEGREQLQSARKRHAVGRVAQRLQDRVAPGIGEQFRDRVAHDCRYQDAAQRLVKV